MKSRKADDLVADLRITFDCLRAKGVKLNPEKCVFGVPRGMLLGLIVSQRGIEPNPEKVSAITRMGPIRDLKGVHRVMRCLASLSRFISRLGEIGLPLYRLLRKTECFSWIPRLWKPLTSSRCRSLMLKVSTDPEAALCSGPGSAQAAALLRGSSRHRGLVFSSGRDSPILEVYSLSTVFILGNSF